MRRISYLPEPSLLLAVVLAGGVASVKTYAFDLAANTLVRSSEASLVGVLYTFARCWLKVRADFATL